MRAVLEQLSFEYTDVRCCWERGPPARRERISANREPRHAHGCVEMKRAERAHARFGGRARPRSRQQAAWVNSAASRSNSLAEDQ